MPWLLAQLPNLPSDPEMANVVWATGKFWIGVVVAVGTLAALLWTTAARFVRLDLTLNTLANNVQKLTGKIDKLADHSSRISSLENWRNQAEGWMRNRRDGDL